MKSRQNLWIFAAAFFWILVIRLHGRQEPLDRDITTYSVVGHQLWQHKWLYRDAWDHKPPAIYILFALVEKFVGYGPQQAFALGLLGAILLLIGLYQLAELEVPGAGMWALAFWTVLSGNIYLEANQPNTELFINVCLVWALVLMRRPSHLKSTREIVGIGSLCALATLFKMVAFFPIIAWAMAEAIADRLSFDWKRWRIIAGTIAGVWAMVIALFALGGAGKDFVDAVFVFNSYYAHKPILASGFFYKLFHSPPLLRLFLPLGGLAIGILIARWRSERRWGIFVGLWIIGSWIAVVSPGQVFSHYLQLLFPVAVFTLATGLQALAAENRLIAPTLGLAILIFLLVIDMPLEARSANEWSYVKYGEQFIRIPTLSMALNQTLEPGESFFVWGTDSGFYFYTRRDPPSRAVNALCVSEGPLVERLAPQVIRDLEQNHPEIILVALAAPDQTKSPEPVRDWIRTHYQPIRGWEAVGYVFSIRRGGELEKRLQKETRLGA
jgi:hypothetical protein